MLDMLYKIAAAVGAFVIAAGGFTAISLLAFKLLGERWVGNEFAKRLETFKHEQQKEIEQVKFQINRLFDRATKLHQREFEVVPKAWNLLLNARRRTDALTAALQSYPDLSRMSSLQRSEYIETCDLENWQKEELKGSSDMNKYYQDAIF